MITMRRIVMPCLLFSAIPDMMARAETLPAESALALARHGEIQPLTRILNRLRPAVDGEIIEVALDRDGARYLYKIKALGQDGQYREYHVDARTGASVGQ